MQLAALSLLTHVRTVYCVDRRRLVPDERLMNGERRASTGKGKKTLGGAGTHTGHTGTRITRIAQTNLTTIQTHQPTRTSQPTNPRPGPVAAPHTPVPDRPGTFTFTFIYRPGECWGFASWWLPRTTVRLLLVHDVCSTHFCQIWVQPVQGVRHRHISRVDDGGTNDGSGQQFAMAIGL